MPLTVYGGGGQTRGYLNLRDTLQCVRLAAEQPGGPRGVAHLQPADRNLHRHRAGRTRPVRPGNQMGLDVEIKSIPNPRKEKEEHYYNPTHSGLTRTGARSRITCPRPCSGAMLERIIDNRERIVTERIMPRVRWS